VTAPRPEIALMSTPAEQSPAAKPAEKPMKIRDAATLILVDAASGEPRILMGKRRMDVVFMPGKYVFPGGRGDNADREVPVDDALDPSDLVKLLHDMKDGPSADRARAMALAAIRETHEETGILIGKAVSGPIESKVPGWQAFFAEGVVPTVRSLRFFARAITPPGRPRRYDTRFFFAEASAIARRTDSNDGELSGLHWLTIAEARNFDLPSITRVIIEDLHDRFKVGGIATANVPVPYYHHTDGVFRREMIRG